MKSFKTPNIQDVFLIFFVVYSFQTIEAKSAFQRETPPTKETHNDVFIHPPPRENDVPLAFKQYGTVVACKILEVRFICIWLLKNGHSFLFPAIQA